MKCINVESMRQVEQQIFDTKIVTELQLMAIAGQGCARKIADFIQKFNPALCQRIVVLCGRSNNGGDGYVIADTLRTLLPERIKVVVYTPFSLNELNPSCTHYRKNLTERVNVLEKKQLLPSDFVPGDIIVEALIGSGFHLPLSGVYINYLQTVNAAEKFVIAIDIPAGLDANCAIADPNVLLADLTLAIGAFKIGLLIRDGRKVCGQLEMIKLPLAPDALTPIPSPFSTATAEEVAKVLPRLNSEKFKNQCGNVLVIGGSQTYGGAPVLAAVCALRSGSGIVRLTMPYGAELYANLIPSVIKTTAPSNHCGFFDFASIAHIADLSSHSDVVIIGPGLGTNLCSIDLLEYIMQNVPRLIIDADALNLLAQNPSLWELRRNHLTLITPHIGEMNRLCQSLNIKADNDALDPYLSIAAQSAQQLQVVTVLKNNRTIIAGPHGNLSVNHTGSPALATAGSGDCLTGIMASIWGQNLDLPPEQIAAAAVYLHGRCGQINNTAQRSFTADMISEIIGQAMQEVSIFA